MSRTHRRLARYIDGEGNEAQRYRELVIDNLDAHTQRLTLVLRDQAFNHYSPDEREYIVLPLAGSVPTVLPVNNENASLAGHAPVVVEFPEALQL